MQAQRYHIRFPSDNLTRASQSEAYFTITEDGKDRRIAFHDYADIYDHPGLYEQLFYQRLKCTSPAKLTELLRDAASKAGDDPTQMRVLDVGAGNGMVGELLVQHAWSASTTSTKPNTPRNATVPAPTTPITSPTSPTFRPRCRPISKAGTSTR